jgi:hypothetical protein
MKKAGDGRSEWLEAHPTSAGGSETGIPRKQRCAEFFGKRHIGRIAGRKTIPGPPNARQKYEVGIPRCAEIEQILDRLIGAWS